MHNLDWGPRSTRSPAPYRNPQCSVQNVIGDAYADLVSQFIDEPMMWAGGTATATLTGNLNNGTPFAGSDEICVVP